MSGKTEKRGRRVLITGGLGYAGGYVSDLLARQGEMTCLLSRGSSRQARNLVPHAPCGRLPDRGSGPVPDGAQNPAPDAAPDAAPYASPAFISADLARTEAAELAGLLPEHLEAVVHAASLNEAFLEDYPRQSLLVNALGTRTLLEALTLKSAASGSPPPLVIYFSTFHVYGRDQGRIDESSPPTPNGDYALSHFFAEEYCRAAMRAKGPPCIILRLSNGYGQALRPEAQKWHLLINDLCRNAVERGELVLRSDPLARRDFVWLGDVARVVLALLERRDLAGRLFNVSSGQSLSLREIAARVARAARRVTGKKVAVREFAPPGEERELAVDNSALRAALDYSFQDRLEEEAAAIMQTLKTGRQ